MRKKFFWTTLWSENGREDFIDLLTIEMIGRWWKLAFIHYKSSDQHFFQFSRSNAWSDDNISWQGASGKFQHDRYAKKWCWEGEIQSSNFLVYLLRVTGGGKRLCSAGKRVICSLKRWWRCAAKDVRLSTKWRSPKLSDTVMTGNFTAMDASGGCWSHERHSSLREEPPHAYMSIRIDSHILCWLYAMFISQNIKANSCLSSPTHNSTNNSTHVEIRAMMPGKQPLGFSHHTTATDIHFQHIKSSISHQHTHKSPKWRLIVSWCDHFCRVGEELLLFESPTIACKRDISSCHQPHDINTWLWCDTRQSILIPTVTMSLILLNGKEVLVFRQLACNEFRVCLWNCLTHRYNWTIHLTCEKFGFKRKCKGSKCVGGVKSKFRHALKGKNALKRVRQKNGKRSVMTFAPRACELSALPKKMYTLYWPSKTVRAGSDLNLLLILKMTFHFWGLAACHLGAWGLWGLGASACACACVFLCLDFL